MGDVRIYRFERTPALPAGSGRFNVDVFGAETAKHALVCYKRLPPHTPLGAYHYHKKSENILVVLQGTLECLVGGVRYLVREGEMIYMPDVVPHATGNPGDIECQSIEFYCPSRGQEKSTMDSFPAELPAKIVDADKVRA